MLQTCQRAQAHLDDSRSLYIAQREPLDHGLFGEVGRLRRPDDADDFIDVVLCNQQTLYDMETFLGFTLIEACTTHNDIVAVVDEMLYQIAHRQQLRPAIDQRDVIDGERRLQLRVLEQRIEHDTGNGIVLQNHDDTQTVTV